MSAGFLAGVEGASGGPDVAEVFAAEERMFGYLPNLARLLAMRPDVHRAWRALNGAIRGGMPLERYELATVAAAAALRSSYCALVHGRMPAGLTTEEEVLQVVEDGDGLAPLDRAVVALARRIVLDATHVGPDDLAPLREGGLSDREILDVVLAITARCFFSKLLDATGTPPDAQLAAMPARLRTALSVGRPIAG